MKKKITIFLILISIIGHGQSMNNGIYFNIKKDIGFESDVFEFKNNEEFNYIFFTCTGTGFGTGTYKLTKDSIHLKFKDITKLKNQTNLEFVKSDSDSLSVNLKILEYKDGSELPSANCYFPTEKIGWSADFYGKVNGTTIRTDSTRTLRIELVGYERIEIQVPHDISEINGIVRLGNLWIYKPADELTYKVISKSNGRFTLARYERKNITYKKIKKGKATEMVEQRTGQTYDHFVEDK